MHVQGMWVIQDSSDVPINDLINKKHAQEYARQIEFNKATPASEVKPLEVIQESKDTNPLLYH